MHPALLRFLTWPRREEGAYPLARPSASFRYSPPPPRRARALWGVWRRCSLLTDRCGYARRSRLAIRPKALSRGVHGYFNRLLGAPDVSCLPSSSFGQRMICRRMLHLLIATHNRNKAAEIRAILAPEFIVTDLQAHPD